MTDTTNATIPNPWLCRFAVFLGVCTLLLLLSGAYITSSEEQAASTDPSVLAGSGQVAALQAILTARNHVLFAGLVGTLTIILAGWLMLAEKKWLRFLGGCATAIFVLNGWVGTRGLPPLSPAIGVCHALLAHIFLSVIVMIAVLKSPGWRRGPEPADDLGHSSLRGLALATPFVVLLQIALGASYRHNLTGVLPHMGGALVATILILIVCLIVTQDFGENQSLHSAAVALLSIILTQITLGIATFTMKLLNFEDTILFLFSSMLHVIVGALTLAATIVMAMQVLRNVRKSEKNVDPAATGMPSKGESSIVM